jgi:hypothetical protein
MRILNKNSNGGRVVVTTDGGAGSSGKGCLNSWLADQHVFHVATNNWMPNAGHITELDDGTRITVQHIPSAFVDSNTELYLNAGAAIDLGILFKEIEMLEDLGFDIKNRLTIHPNANVIIEEDRETEKRLIKSGSTFKGCGAALAGKTLRQGRKLAKDYDELAPYIKDRTQELNERIAKGIRVLVEGSQGVDLDINHAQFPYCTSRQTHPTQLLADAGLPANCVTNIIVNIRTNPIRISNISAADGTNRYTGDYWEARELSWEDVAIQAGWDDPEEFIEHYGFAMRTTVTKKVRRVFEFPVERMKFIHAMCGGLLDDSTLLYSLNFVNFVDKNVEGATTYKELMTPKVRDWLDKNLYPVIGPNRLKWVRTGPRHSQIVELLENVQNYAI